MRSIQTSQSTLSVVRDRSVSWDDDLSRRVEKARLKLHHYGGESGLRELRSIQYDLPARQLKANFSRKAAAIDPEAALWKNQGAQYRDAGQHDQAEYYFWLCNQAYPWHPEFELEYALALHRQKKFFDSEPRLRSAIALGLDPRPIYPIIYEISRELGDAYVEVPRSRIRPEQMTFINQAAQGFDDCQLPPDLESVRILTEVLMGSRNQSANLYYKIMRSCPGFWDVLVFITESSEFRAANLDLIYVLGKISKTTKKKLRHVR